MNFTLSVPAVAYSSAAPRRLKKCRRPALVSDWATKIFGYIVSVDEGHFDKKGKYVADRRRNGDEIFRRGLWVEPDNGVLRVITCD